MGDLILVLFFGGIVILLWGLSSLFSGEVHLGKKFRFSDQEIITKGRIPSLIHGLPLTVAGACGLLAGVLSIFDPESEYVEQLMKLYITLLLIGVVGSFLASAIGLGASAEETDPKELAAARKQFEDKYGRL